jgi:hypothetical protein
MTKVTKYTVGLVALVLSSLPCLADISLDYGSMTNTASVFASGTSSASNIIIPVVIGVILFCAGIGVWYRFSGKAKIRS